MIPVVRFAPRVLVAVLVAAMLPAIAVAQPGEAMKLGVSLSASHHRLPDVRYITASGFEAKVDVYASRAVSPAPTLVYIHGDAEDPHAYTAIDAFLRKHRVIRP